MGGGGGLSKIIFARRTEASLQATPLDPPLLTIFRSSLSCIACSTEGYLLDWEVPDVITIRARQGKLAKDISTSISNLY